MLTGFFTVCIIVLVSALLYSNFILRRRLSRISSNTPNGIEEDLFSEEDLEKLKDEMVKSELDYRMSLGQEASVEEEVKAHSLEFYKSKNNGKWYWRIKAANGNIIGASSQGYVRRDDCEYNSKSVAVSVVNHEFGN